MYYWSLIITSNSNKKIWGQSRETWVYKENLILGLQRNFDGGTRRRELEFLLYENFNKGGSWEPRNQLPNLEAKIGLDWNGVEGSTKGKSLVKHGNGGSKNPTWVTKS